MKRILFLMVVIIVILLSMNITVCADVQISDINSGWYWPTSSSIRTITSEFGRVRTDSIHQAIDIAGSEGSPVYAARAGDVVESFNSCKGSHNNGSCSCSGGAYYGNYVVIYHGVWNGHKIYSMYMHLKSVNVGTSVKAGQEIGKIGNTGPSDGAHLHFQISKGSKNPKHNNITEAKNNFINTNPSKAMFSNKVFSHNRIGSASYPYSEYGNITYIMNGVNVTPNASTISGITVNSTSSLTIEWTKVSGATSYSLYRRKSGDAEYSLAVSSTTSTSYTDTGLEAGTQYWYRVYAINESGTSGRSESAGAYTRCAIPTINSVSSTSTDSITIGWKGVKGASSYRIDRRDNDVYTTIATGITGTSFTDTGLKAGAKHFYRVYAINENSISEKPDGYRAFVQCEIPTINSVSSTSTDSITIGWKGVSGATSYRIDRRDNDVYTTIATGITGTSYTDTGLKAGAKHFYRVYAVNDNSVSQKPDGYRVFVQCEMPTNNSVSSTSTDSITIGWKGVSGATSYRIDRRDNDVYTTIATGITGTSYTDTGLKAGAKHFYRVYAVNDNSVSQRPDGYRAFVQCEKPVISSSTLTSNSITIAWNAVAGASYYRIDRRMKGTDEYFTIVESTTNTKFTDTGLNPSSMYYYRIYAINDNSISAKPDEVGFYTKAIYTISYNVNGGNGTIPSQTKVQDTSLTLSSVKPTRIGYTFKGWNTNSAETGTSYVSGDSYTQNASITLYAVWEAKTYQVFFDVTGTAMEIEPIVVTYDSCYGVLPIPKREGIIFKGWYTGNEGGTEITSSTKVTITEDLTLYPRWEYSVPVISPVVITSNLTCMVKAELFGYSEECNVIVAAYRGGEFIDFRMVPYEENISVTFTDELDEIKIMVWSGTGNLTPVCDAIDIPRSEWIIE